MLVKDPFCSGCVLSLIEHFQTFYFFVICEVIFIWGITAYLVAIALRRTANESGRRWFSTVLSFYLPFYLSLSLIVFFLLGLY